MSRKIVPARSAARRAPAIGAAPTVLDVVRLRAEALLAGHAAEAELAVLQQRERLAAARSATEAREAEAQVARALRASGAGLERAALNWAIEREGLALERERRRAERLRLRRNPLPPPAPALPSRVELALEDRQIDALALRFVHCLAQLDPADAEAAWAGWTRALCHRYPANVAGEVVHRAEQLLELLG